MYVKKNFDNYQDVQYVREKKTLIIIKMHSMYVKKNFDNYQDAQYVREKKLW